MIEQGNRTERLQRRYRNGRWGQGSGCYAGEFPPRPLVGMVIKGDPKRRERYRQVTVATQRILNQALELSSERKSAPEILKDLGFPNH